ncbi:hypothetical protein ASF73_04310 [Xanthomonas sp. Leaf131]|nr:hypothetical protein ASF73_04310 [Xanthomonas sp. Leaf131]
MQACAQGAFLPPPPPPSGAAPPDDASARRLDRAAFERCLASKGAPPPHPRGVHDPGEADAWGEPGQPDEPQEPPPDDPEFDAALQACATAQGIDLPAPGAPPMGPPSPMDRAALAQCLDAEGFIPPPRRR